VQAAGDRVELLRASSFFGGLGVEELEKLAVQFRPRTYAKGQDIWLEGQPSTALAVIRSGWVKLIKHSESGRDLLIELLGPFEVIGAVVLLEGRPYPVTARALDEVELLMLSRESFLAVIAENPSIAAHALKAIGARLRRAHEMMRQFTMERVESRIANVLLALVDRTGDAARSRPALGIKLTRKDLAEMAGTSVETAIRIMKRWEKEGVIAAAGTRLVLTNVDELQAIGAGNL